MICNRSAGTPKLSRRPPQNRLGEDVIESLTKLHPDSKKTKVSLIHRINVLSELEPGWLCGSKGYYGKVPSRNEWEWLHEQIENYPVGLPKAFIFPTIEGGLRFEWVFSRHIIEAEIQPSIKKAIGRVVCADTLFEIPGKTNEMDLRENWTSLFDFVRREREQ